MTICRSIRRLAATAAVAVAAAGFAAPADASPADHEERCAAGLITLEEKFRHMEEHRGWEDAADWWGKRWAAYYKQCLQP